LTDLLAHIRRTCAAYGLLAPGATVLVAASGGADSTALLHALVRLGAEMSLRLEVAHLDHGLRGAESAADAAFVEGLAASLALPCHVERLAEGCLRRQGVSLQEAAREARLAWLERVAREIGATRVALGHTADDLAEEVLMRLLSGAGARGLAGMRPRRGKFIRPLTHCRRADIEAWLTGQGLTWREDSSNRKGDYLRNRVRLSLVPELAAGFNPNLTDSLCRQATILGDEDDLLDALAAEALGGLAREEAGALTLDCAGLAALHPALQRRVIRLACQRLSGGLRGLTFRHVEAVLNLGRSASPSASLSLPGGLAAQRRYGELLIRLTPSRQPTKEPDWELMLPAPGAYELPEAGRRLIVRPAQRGDADAGAATFDAAALTWPLLARNPRPGDRLQPRGMSGHKLVFRLLSDAKVPRAERWRVPVLLSAGIIIWVGGLRAAEFGQPAGQGALLAASIE